MLLRNIPLRYPEFEIDKVIVLYIVFLVYGFTKFDYLMTNSDTRITNFGDKYASSSTVALYYLHKLGS